VDHSAMPMLQEHLLWVTSRFVESMQPSTYLHANKKMWRELHRLLHAHDQLPFTMDQLMNVLRSEAPHLFTDDSDAAGIPTGDDERPSSDYAQHLMELTSEDRLAAIQIEVTREAKEIVGPDYSPESCLFEAGMDSLASSDLSLRLRRLTGLNDIIPSVFEDHRSSHAVAAHVLARLEGVESSSPHQMPSSEKVSKGHAGLPWVTSGIRKLYEQTQVPGLIVILPSTWGTVEHYVNCARQLSLLAWGIEHSYLTSRNEGDLGASTLEEYAASYADLVVRACSISEMQPPLHFLGGSFGALLAHKVAIATRRLHLGHLQPDLVVMIDPPPPGPCLLEAASLSTSWLGQEFVRLFREIAGLDALSSTERGALQANLDQAQSPWETAILVVEELTLLGQGPVTSASVTAMKLRMDVFPFHMRLWHAQSKIPEWYAPPAGRSFGIVLCTSSERSRFYTPVYGSEEDDLEMYGPCLALPVIQGEHTVVVQRVCTGREEQITSQVAEALRR